MISSTSFTFSPILANLSIPNALKYIYEPMSLWAMYVFVGLITQTLKAKKLQYVYCLKHGLCTKWLLQMNLNKGQPQSPGAECQLQTADCCLQTAIPRLPDISRAAPICTRGDWGGSCKLANLRTAKSCCTTNIQHNCITDYNSKIHMLKYIMNKNRIHH